jgi:pimeloyl-ACP methyl ester carboxylesterase
VRELSGVAVLLKIGDGNSSPPREIADLGEEGYADSGGVTIHYVTKGKGPLVVLIHGFPDFWYTWRGQIPELAKHFQVVAIDQRGYNKSDQPKKVEDYAMDKLVDDVAAVLKHFKRKKAHIIGHDWGGAVAWYFAMIHPDKVERLAILNCPHPNGLMRELAKKGSRQEKNSAYARAFQRKNAAKLVSVAQLAQWVKEPEARKKYDEALNRSSLEGMLNYYKANYPRHPYKVDREFPLVKCPVLMIHGLKDKYLLPETLNGTKEWLRGELTLLTIPDADHFVHRDAEKMVTKRLVSWLTQE